MPFLQNLRWFFEPIIECFVGPPPDPLDYQASFIKESKVLKRNHTGFCLTGIRSLSRKESFQNALVIGPSGAGKSSVIFIPTILKAKDASFVIHDPSGELFQATSGYLFQQGYTIQILNFADENQSDGFNPLARANTSGEINKVASMIIRTVLSEGSKDPFWNLQATSLLGMMIGIIKTEAPKLQTLRNVRELIHLLGTDEKAISAMIKGADQSELLREFNSFMAFDEKVKAGVIASVLAALQIFTDETVGRVTSFDSLDPMQFRARKTALFIQNSVTDGQYYNILSSLFFEQFFAALFQRLPQTTDYDVLFLVDEAGVLHIPSLAQVISNVRKYRAGILLGMQDFQQLVEHYGPADAQTIRANTYVKLYLSGQSHRGSEEISQALGQTAITTEEGQHLVRPLRTSDEVRMLPPNRAILIIGHYAPMSPTLVPYYRQPSLTQLASYPIPQLPRKLPYPPLSIADQSNHDS